jgi:hypothetical protein
MAMMDRIGRWAASGRALDMAERLARQAREAGAPPSVGRLAPRPRAAYDRLLDALNRLPRPLMAVGTLALIGAAVVAPAWFADRMEALSRMPEGLWWIVGAVVSLHFGSRYQAYAQAHERDLVETVSVRAPEPSEPFVPPTASTPAAAAPGPDAAVVLGTLGTGPNAALDEWRAQGTQPGA